MRQIVFICGNARWAFNTRFPPPPLLAGGGLSISLIVVVVVVIGGGLVYFRENKVGTKMIFQQNNYNVTSWHSLSSSKGHSPVESFI